MEGDFSRGYRPDHSRDERYRRVLLRQGAAVLDSDLAAMVEANETLARDGLRQTAGELGSPDFGYMLTGGELLAHFADPAGIAHGREGLEAFEPRSGATAVVDFSRRLHGRLPGLLMSGAADSTVVIRLGREVAGGSSLRLWMRAVGATAKVRIGGEDFDLGADYDARTVEIAAAADTLEIVNAGEGEALLAMVETVTDAPMHVTEGSYQIAGVAARTKAVAWPGFALSGEDLTKAANTAFTDHFDPSNGDRYVAFLEMSERLITGIDAPGIVERALGGYETAMRTQVHAQVKLAKIGTETAENVEEAVLNAGPPEGTVGFGVKAAARDPDPCALPAPEGYTGPENRLYRLVVHSAAETTVFKWSNENGSELFEAAAPDDGASVTVVHLPPDTPLRDGDLVEVFDAVTALVDAAPGALDGEVFTRPERAAGALRQLSGGEATGTGARRFALKERDGGGEQGVAIRTGAPLRLRRWSGFFEHSGGETVEHPLEHGVLANVKGPFEAGDWWQYEARPVGANVGDGLDPSPPHGPERLFAPLAIFEAGEDNALSVERWLDRRHPPLTGMNAAAVSYDARRVGSPVESVQEALDSLLLRGLEGCGEIPLAKGEDVPVQDIFDHEDLSTNDDSGRICLNAGLRNLRGNTIHIRNKRHVIVGGVGGGTVLRTTGACAMHFENCESVTLMDFAIEAAGSQKGALGGLLTFTNCPEILIERVRITRNAPSRGFAAIHSDSSAKLVADRKPPRRTVVRDCRITLGGEDTGVRLIDPGVAEVRDNDIRMREEDGSLPDFDLVEALKAGDEILLDQVARVFIDGIAFEDDANFKTKPGPLRERVDFKEGLWGSQAPGVSFLTHPELAKAADPPNVQDRIWNLMASINESGDDGGSVALQKHLRDLRLRIVRTLFKLPGDKANFSSTGVDLESFMGNVATLVAKSAAKASGEAGILVEIRNGSSIETPTKPAGADPSTSPPASSAIVERNIIRGCHIGIAAQGVSRKADAQILTFLLADARVDSNVVELAAPLHAPRVAGVACANAHGARVTGNRTTISARHPTCAGVLLDGLLGRLAQATGNFAFGVTFGVRFAPDNWPVSDEDRKRVRRLFRWIPLSSDEDDNAFVGETEEGGEQIRQALKTPGVI